MPVKLLPWGLIDEIGTLGTCRSMVAKDWKRWNLINKYLIRDICLTNC